jgi:TRAP-type C4-dicarboxylate transport system permease small subunit
MPEIYEARKQGGWLATMGQAFDRLLAALSYLAGGILLFMGASVLYEVFMRYLFNLPTRWVIEFSEYMLLYMALLAGAWVLKREEHVKVEMLVEALPRKAQAVLHAVTSWVGALVCALFFWYSASLVWEQFHTGEVLFRAVHVPKWAVLVSIPIGLLLLTVQFVRRAFVQPGEVEKEAEPGL